MIDRGKFNILGVQINAIDYAAAVERIITAAQNQQPLAVTALAVHGVMTGVLDKTQRYRLNHLDLITPDGQPVRWALNRLHATGLTDRVYGPTLTLKLCERAAVENLPIYLYGSKPETLDLLAKNLTTQFPALKIAGMQPSMFRRVTPAEKLQIASQIQASGAKLVLVGLGCPRQETWAYEYRDALPMPLIAVGAAFDFHAGTVPQAPAWMQKRGLEWFYRLTREPSRLWKRYLLLNPLYLWLLLLQATHLKVNDPTDAVPPAEEMRYG
ncbi:MAG: WecB/TagA/CpsF family glycosyltransferase [Chloroflexi bacterium]|nr:WecB/TagA/CpsF family glycosyltransferase [Chloroflexota bacterium]